MVRRIVTFLAFIALVGAVSSLVYFNVHETAFRLTPQQTFTLPLGVLMLAAAVAGAVVMFVIALMREGRHALRDWRVHRELRTAQRNVESVAEARSLTLAGDFKRARALLTKVAQKRSPETGDIIDYAETFLLENDPAQARRVLEEGQRDFGNKPLLLFALARACRAAGDLPAAISALERALEVYPRSLPMLTMLRDLLFENEAWQRAERVQRQLVELKPDDSSERNWLLGARYETAVRAEGAARDIALKSLCDDNPDFLPALIERARLLEAEGDPRHAARLLEKSSKRKPHGIVLDEIEKLLAEEDPARVAKLYVRLVAADPVNIWLKLRAARFLVSSGHIDEADQVLAAMSGNGQPAYAQALWAAIHESREKEELARAAYQRAFADSDLTTRHFACEVCGVIASDWQTRCDHCGAWGMLESL